MLCSSSKSVDEEKGKSIGRKAVSFVLITVTGGVALSALDDLLIYHGCSRYASSSSQFLRLNFSERVFQAVFPNVGFNLLLAYLTDSGKYESD